MRRPLALLAFLLAFAIPAGTASADPPLKEQAIDIMSHSYGGFINAKNSPSRNNQFDWASDGCSGPHTNPVDLLQPFYVMHNAPCQLHDFGYRNFGNGLRLERTEERRAWIDGRFYAEMQRNCDEHWWYVGCGTAADAFYAAVRVANDWGS
jgi:Prokaryotic phospholipase A2